MNAKLKKWLKKIVPLTVSVIGVAAGICAIVQFIETRSEVDLCGEWKVADTIESTSYKPYKGLELGFRVFIKQKGDSFTAEGEKCWVNGKELPISQRTPIYLEGVIKKDKVHANIIEKGLNRRTIGAFVWTLSNDNKNMVGTFTSTAGSSSGRSIATKIK